MQPTSSFTNEAYKKYKIRPTTTKKSSTRPIQYSDVILEFNNESADIYKDLQFSRRDLREHKQKRNQEETSNNSIKFNSSNSKIEKLSSNLAAKLYRHDQVFLGFWFHFWFISVSKKKIGRNFEIQISRSESRFS